MTLHYLKEFRAVSPYFRQKIMSQMEEGLLFLLQRLDFSAPVLIVTTRVL